MYSTIFKNDALFAKIHYSDPEGKDYINFIKNLEDYSDNCIIDINISNKIEILKVNTFKTIPSTVRSIEKILLIKQENLLLNDIISI